MTGVTGVPKEERKEIRRRRRLRTDRGRRKRKVENRAVFWKTRNRKTFGRQMIRSVKETVSIN